MNPFARDQIVRLADPAVVHFEDGGYRWVERWTQYRVLHCPGEGPPNKPVKVEDSEGRRGLVAADLLEPVPVEADPESPADPDDGDDPTDPQPDTGDPVGKVRKHRRPDLPAKPLLKELIRAGLVTSAAKLAG